ncbi:MAG: cytochrome P450 [Ilumatobacteraceae bacterium]
MKYDLSYDVLDVISHASYKFGPPFELYRQMRNEAPVLKCRGVEPTYTEEFWAITRHVDVVEVSRKFQTFSSAKKGSLMNEAPTEIDNDSARLMIDLDPPDHTRLRTLVSRGFTPKAMRMLESHFRDVAIQLIEEAIEAGSVDFVDKVSAELPLIAIAELVGIPVEDRRKVFDWSNAMIGANDPEYGNDPEAGMAAATELYMYSNQLALERRANPKDDIITTLISEHDGDVLSEHEFDLFMLLLAVAGNETTRNGISHGVAAMIEHPDEWRRLQADPSLVTSAVEEILRWATPVNYFRRAATCDVELHGVTIAEGESVTMFYPSANRDERVFTDPDRFDIGRTPNPHVTFGGGGPHFCLGSNLARLEMRILFEELSKRVADVNLTGEISKLQSSFIHGIKHLPVALTRR